MNQYFHRKMKFLFILLIAIFVIISVVIWEKYPFGVKHYKTVSLGMAAAEKAGDSTGWAPPDHFIPESRFYIYALGDEGMCIGGSCGIGGYFTECLGGWISGYKDIGDVRDYGLGENGFDIDKQKIITIADKDAKIVGIYPGASIRNLPYILRNHRDLAPDNVFEDCSNSLPTQWK